MFLRITRSRIDPAMPSLQEVVDAMQRLPGFQHAYHAGDRERGRAIIVSVWDTREHARFDRAELADLVSRIQSLGAELDAPEIYEIGGGGTLTP